jgi:ribonuclease BN (tRNA processing enzyme)
MLVDRRHVLKSSLASAALTIVPSTLARSESGPEAVTLCLLGTKGGPSVRDINQLPFSNLLRIGPTSYIIDAAYGTTYRLVEKGISLASIRCIFVSHHHSDHNLEVGPLLFNAWANGLKHPIDVYGPAGIDHLTKAYLDSNKIDIDVRVVDEGRPDLRTLVADHAFKEGFVMADQNICVSALRVPHPPIESYALKFEIRGGKTLVFSGDTAYFPPLAEFAKNADFMVHEVMYGPWA